MRRRLPFTFFLVFAGNYATVAQQCELNAEYEVRTSRVLLYWNMVPHPSKTTYVLFRSTDAKNWREVVTDKIPRKYSEEDVFDYDDRVNRSDVYYYQIKIVDANNKTIALSNIASVSTGAEKTSWTIYPNPANDILHLVCEGSNVVKGVISVTVQDLTGKIVIRFRAASTNRSLEIPVSKLRKGAYVVQISIMNQTVLSQQFIKL